MSNEQLSKKISEIISKSQTDEGFRLQLLSNANATLAAEGVVLPAGITVNVLENTNTVINYILPPNPQAELSDADLDKVAGGTKAKDLAIAGKIFKALEGGPRRNSYIEINKYLV